MIINKIVRCGRAFSNAENYVFVEVETEQGNRLVVSNDYPDKDEGGMYWFVGWVLSRIQANDGQCLTVFKQDWIEIVCDNHVSTKVTDAEAIQERFYKR